MGVALSREVKTVAFGTDQDVSVCYCGSFRQTRTYVPQLLQYARDNGMAIRGPLLELLWIDIHTTKHVEEQVTELQLKVEVH